MKTAPSAPPDTTMDAEAEMALVSYHPETQRICDNPRCRRPFFARLPWQRFCGAVCRRTIERAVLRQKSKLYREWAQAVVDGKPPEIAAAEDLENNPGRLVEQRQTSTGGGRMRSTAPLQNQRIDGFGAKREAQERFGMVDGRADVRVRPGGAGVLRERRK